ncbi:HDIG domain-containing metalloprotein [Caloramator sp. Dgby_cultured_2]|uniref:HDIG domain-containing metalloprotein n=1 Tax=Caloramator sp. Dgby_cultured_2 TaxID=3029174 RepID=UPI00406C0C06
MVGNLAEAAAEKIGANSLLARVGAYYHDIGKIKRPYFLKKIKLLMTILMIT